MPYGTIGSFHAGIPAAAAAGFDAATTAWVAAVVTNGGTVSDPRKSIVDALIVGLKADGVFTKLDRLWLFAAEDEGSALVDLVSLVVASKVLNGGVPPAFTVDRGYNSGAAGRYVNGNTNLSGGLTNYQQNSACIFGWSNSDVAESTFFVGQISGSVNFLDLRDGGQFYWNINSSAAFNDHVASSSSLGFFATDRNAASGAGCTVGYKNGSSVGTGSQASTTPPVTFSMCFGGGTTSTLQCSGAGLGGHLTGTEHTNLYTRLRTYMTAVGVP